MLTGGNASVSPLSKPISARNWTTGGWSSMGPAALDEVDGCDFDLGCHFANGSSARAAGAATRAESSARAVRAFMAGPWLESGTRYHAACVDSQRIPPARRAERLAARRALDGAGVRLAPGRERLTDGAGQRLPADRLRHEGAGAELEAPLPVGRLGGGAHHDDRRGLVTPAQDLHQ